MLQKLPLGAHRLRKCPYTFRNVSSRALALLKPSLTSTVLLTSLLFAAQSPILWHFIITHVSRSVHCAPYHDMQQRNVYSVTTPKSAKFHLGLRYWFTGPYQWLFSFLKINSHSSKFQSFLVSLWKVHLVRMLRWHKQGT